MIPHTGIVVFGIEYFFGSGPCTGEPGKSVGMPPHQILDLGETDKSQSELEAHIQSTLASEYTQEKYNLTKHNCNHYADEVAKFLLKGQGLPSSIVNIADEALSTPQGQQLRAMIENLEASMRSQMGGASALNPYGNVGSAGSATAMPTLIPPSISPTVPAPAAVGGNEELEQAMTELKQSNSVEAQTACLQTLLKLTENIEKNGAEPKYRQVKMANAAFTKKVGECSGGTEIMLAAGWMPSTNPEGDDIWLLGDEHVTKQGAIKQRLAAELQKIAPPAPTQPVAPANPATNTAGMGDFGGLGGGLGGMPGGFGGMGGMGGMPGGLNSNAMQQMMQNPQMMQQAQQMMQNNPQMMAQAQQMMQNPQMMQQVQQMMNDPQMMAQMQNMMGGGGGFR